MNQCTWPLGNNQSLTFNIYDPKTISWSESAGLYIFAHLIDSTHWRAFYVGQTDNFKSRIPNHERWSSALRLGATHVHALAVPLAANRDTWEKRLIAFLQPVLNDQLRASRYSSM